MPKPLRSNEANPEYVQFRDFGVLNDGQRSKGAAITAITVNVLIALALLFLVKAAVNKPKEKHAELIDPIHAAQPEPPPPPKIKIKLPPPPPPPKIKIVEPPPVPQPPIPVPPPPVPPPPTPAPSTPKPTPAPPAPKLQPAPPAPKAVNMMGTPAHVPNSDVHPSAVRLGSPDNPLKPMTGPAVQRVSMGVAGMPGMPGSNTGSGPRAVNVSMGSGSPGSQNLNATAPRQVNGLATGCVGCNGPMNSKSSGIQRVAMNTAPLAQPVSQPRVQAAVAKSAPTLVYKPAPIYTEEAKSMHLEGNVSVRIRVSAEGTVQVLGVVSGLGHGLDQAAVQAAEGTRFKPAVDATGNPVPWEGVVLVRFQMS